MLSVPARLRPCGAFPAHTVYKCACCVGSAQSSADHYITASPVHGAYDCRSDRQLPELIPVSVGGVLLLLQDGMLVHPG